MIHGVLYRSEKKQLHPSILNGTHPVLTIDPLRQRMVTWSDAHCWLGQSVDRHDALAPFSEIHSQVQIVAWARLDNRNELLSKLNIKSNSIHNLSDSKLILLAYLRFGENCTKHLYGDFCFSIYDQRTQTLLCVRDQMGTKPFYYYIDKDVLVFSSSLSLFHVLDFVQVRPCMEWASKFLVANMSMDFRKTAYHNIFKLPPAHQFIGSKQSVNEKRYFEFHTDKIQLRSSQAYVEMYQSELERAIKSRIKTEHPLGSEISGGIDSSTVTAYAAKYFSKPLSDFYTFGFAHLVDEPNYILQVNQRYNIQNCYICCDNPYYLYNTTRALQVLGAPVEHPNATGHEIFYDMAAKNNVRTLLSGFGGDEFVTSIHCDLYLYELLKSKQYLKLYNNLLGNSLTRALRFAKLCYKTDKQGGKISTSMREALDSRWADVIIADDLIRAYGIQEKYQAIGDFDHGYSSLDQFTLEKRWAPFVTTRMENCTLMAASYGIDYRWPLLDARLIQCFLSIPSSEKYHKGIGRYLHRRAIANTVPKKITWKVSKSMGNRANTSERFTPTLNDDLHPELLPLLNLDKLKQQINNSSKRITMASEIQINKNIHQINRLDDWLKYYFKQGFYWVSPSIDRMY